MSVTHIRYAPAGDYAWQAGAACSGASAELFLGPDIEVPAARSRRESLALQLCCTCPVRGACLAHALLIPERHGVWGGTTPEQRRLTHRTGSDLPPDGPGSGPPPAPPGEDRADGLV